VTTAQVIGLVLGIGALMVAIIGGQSFWLGRHLDVRFAAMERQHADQVASLHRSIERVQRRLASIEGHGA
jgi:hypothetical protein